MRCIKNTQELNWYTGRPAMLRTMYQTFINVLIPRAKAHCAKLSSQMRTSRLWKSIALPNSWSLPVQLLNLVTDRNWSLSICFNSTIQFHKTDAQRICNWWSEMRYWTFKSSQSGGCLAFALALASGELHWELWEPSRNFYNPTQMLSYNQMNNQPHHLANIIFICWNFICWKIFSGLPEKFRRP